MEKHEVKDASSMYEQIYTLAHHYTNNTLNPDIKTATVKTAT